MFFVVPLGPELGIANTKVRRQIDNARPGRQQLRYRIHGNIVRSCKKHHIALSQLVGFRFGKAQIQTSTQTGKQFVNTHTGLGARGNHAYLRTGMVNQNSQQFSTCISGATNNTYL